MDRDKRKTLNIRTDRELTSSLAGSCWSPSIEQEVLGSEPAEAVAPSAPVQHLSDYACIEPTVPLLESTPEGRVTAQFHIAKPVHSRDYKALDKKGLDVHS